MAGPRILAGELKREIVTMLTTGVVAGVTMAELFRRYHTEPHKQQRTEYYRRLGIEFKSIID